MMRFHHLGIACFDHDDLEAFITALKGKRISETIYDKAQNASLTLFQLPDKTLVEAISGEVVKGYVKKGIQLYHVCYEVDDMETVLEAFLHAGAICVSLPKRAVLFAGRRVCFLHTPLGLVELLDA